MNNIKTTDVSDPTIEQPFTASSLDFLQAATKESVLGLAQSLIGDSYDSTKSYVLKGLTAYGTNQYTEGYVLSGGELYYCAGKATTTAFVNVAVLTITVTNDATADPLTFTDGNARNVHNVRRMVLSDAVSGSGTVNLSACIYIYTKSNWTTVTPFNLNWVAAAGLQAPRYRFENGSVVLSGFLDNIGAPINQLAFTLPVGFRPFVTNVFIAGGATTFAITNYIVITSDGKVTVNYTGTSGVSLCGIRFPID